MRDVIASDLRPSLADPPQHISGGTEVLRKCIDIMDFFPPGSFTHASLHMNFQK
ncbi:hypothetical protein JJB98_07790 [Bradyrhizobium diazoefficiens]|nr:hypothetical protein [Bradyrhizobium diazoefficiens]QQO19818.1 hypothetical protein JJB98_07790 [Bradyrhizobium diazoefficiens]